MNGALLRAESSAMVPAIVLVGAMAMARRWAPGPTARSTLQHFTAGVVFSTVAVELLPDLIRTHAVVEVVSGFVLGVSLMLVIRRLTGAPPPSALASDPAASTLPIGMLTAVGIDILLDGLLVGLGFSVGSKEGVMITAALSLELLSLGLVTGATLARSRGMPAVLAVAGLLAAALLVGTTAGFVLLRNASDHVMAGVLSLGCAALLFLVTEELLVEAHEEGETTFATSMFFAGFVLFLILGMVG